MVTSIQIGNAFQQNGRTIIGGSQSGLDIKSLVDALATAKAQPATVLTTKNTPLAGQQKAYADLKTVLTQFQSASDTLRNPPGVGNESRNVFQYRTANISTNDGSSASNYLTATVQPGAQIQSFSVDKITQLAQVSKQQTGNFALADSTTAPAVAASSTPGQFTAGTFTLKAIDGGADVSITLNAGDSLQTVANDFNLVQSRTGIQATIIQVSTGNYRIIFTGTTTGAANGFDLASAATVTSDPSGVLSNVTSAVGFGTTQSAQDALLTVNGIDLQRSSNAIDDIFTGVTLNLRQSTLVSNTALTVDVKPDATIASNAISQFVDAYNNFKLFASTQQQRNTDGTPNEKALLVNDQTLRSIISDVNAQVTSVISGIVGSNPSRLEDVGVSFTDFAGDDKNPATKNVLNVDTDKLNSALSTNFNGVANLFQYNLTSNNASLGVYARTKNSDVSAVQITITRGTNTYQATYTDPSLGSVTVNLTATAIGTAGALSLVGPAGSALDGLTLVYGSAGDATINATITQGFGDKIYNTINAAIDSTIGSLTLASQAVVDQQSRNTDEITKINDFVAKYRDQITQKYANLEAALTKSNQLLQLLQAQQDARNNA
ncbi:MAG: flagellar filament capping protein FliD [Rickettsiales bacterium]